MYLLLLKIVYFLGSIIFFRKKKSILTKSELESLSHIFNLSQTNFNLRQKYLLYNFPYGELM